MRRLAVSVLLVTFVIGLGAAGGHACCRSLVMKLPSYPGLAAMPCCPQPCTMQARDVGSPAVPEISAALRLLARPAVSSATVQFEPVTLTAARGAQRPDSIPARPPRVGLALRSTLLI